MGIETSLKEVVLSYPHLLKKEAVKGGTPKYRANFLFGKDDPQIKDIEKIVHEVAEEKWGKRAQEVLKTIWYDKMQFCLRKGKEGEISLASSNIEKPTLLSRTREKITDDETANALFFGGAYVNALLEIYAIDNAGVKGVFASLLGVQFVRKGNRLGNGRVAKEDDFEDLGEDEEDIDPFSPSTKVA